MSEEQLRRELLEMLKQAAVHGASLRASELLETGRQQLRADEFDVRQAIWHLLSTDQIELTDDRKLRPATATQQLTASSAT